MVLGLGVGVLGCWGVGVLGRKKLPWGLGGAGCLDGWRLGGRAARGGGSRGVQFMAWRGPRMRLWLCGMELGSQSGRGGDKWSNLESGELMVQVVGKGAERDCLCVITRVSVDDLMFHGS